MEIIKKIAPFVAIIIISALLAIIWFLYRYPYNRENDFSSFTVCTGNTLQEACSKNPPEIRVNWHFNAVGRISVQAYRALEVDNEPDFSSPEYFSGEVENREEWFLASSENLKPGETYYWRIKIGNDRGLWSDWVMGDEPFTVNEFCPGGNPVD